MANPRCLLPFPAPTHSPSFLSPSPPYLTPSPFPLPHALLCPGPQTVVSDDEAKLGRGPDGPAPRWLGELLATLLTWLGPKGLEFGRYSIDYHYIRNWLYVMRHWGAERAAAHVPAYAKRIVAQYDGDAQGRPVSKRLAMAPSLPPPQGGPKVAAGGKRPAAPPQ